MTQPLKAMPLSPKILTHAAFCNNRGKKIFRAENAFLNLKINWNLVALHYLTISDYQVL